MITCVMDYAIDLNKIDAFEEISRRWVGLVSRHGGTHHGYYLPAAGSGNRALALFSYPNLTAYERYRFLLERDPDFVEANRIRNESRCVFWHDRVFMRPLSMNQGDQADG
ncbi:NIPSNAP family protein [Methylobacterium sp. P31]